MAPEDHQADNDAARSRPRLHAVAMSDLGAERQHQNLRLKMGIHEGSCLAVTLNGQQDYFGQTVNIAASQGLAASRSIVVTESVVENAHARALLETNGLNPTPRRVALSGIADKVSVIRDFLGTALVGG
jgi:class 3 adenylate cyclase